MEASRLRTLMKKSRLLPQALCFLSLFLIFGVQIHAQTCQDMTLGVGGSLNGFLPFQGTTPTLYGPSAWNYQVYNGSTYTSGVTIDPNSAAIISGLSNSKLHPDFGPAGGMPYTVVDSSVQPSVDILGVAAGPPGPDATQSDAVIEPAPANAPIEGQQPNCLSYPAGGPSNGQGSGEDYYFGDTHMLIIDRNQCFLYETYLTSECDGQISASGQTVWDLEYGEVRPYGWTSSDAAGLPVWPGLVKYDEAISGVINHAFRFTTSRTKGDGDGGYFVFPAGHGAAPGYRYNSLNVMGMRMILNPTTDISSFSPLNQTILTAMMQYGLILADNGSNMFVSGTTDSRWSTDDLGNWHGGGSVDCGVEDTPGEPCYLTSKDFEVLQMSPEDINLNDSGGTPAAESYSYMDANSAPYTVNDVEQGTYSGGTGPEGTSLSGSGAYPNAGASTAGAPPVISSFGAYYTLFGFPISGNECGSVVSTGLPLTFFAHVTGSTYQYIDNAGPFRLGIGHIGEVTVTPTNTQTYTVYAMNPSGMTESSACTLYTNNAMLPIPVLAPTTGTYNTIINVTISDPGYPGATIYYTTDETEPSYPPAPYSTQQVYTGAITITSTTPDPLTYLPGEQINAIAVDTTGAFSAPSGIGSAVYVVNGAPPAPVISPAAGTYNVGQTITITEDPSFEPIDINQSGDEAFVYYTTDGSTPGGDWYGDPTGTSMVCGSGVNAPGFAPYPPLCSSGVLNLTTTTTVEAIATAVGYGPSAVSTSVFTVPLTYTMTVSPSTLVIDPSGNAGSVSVALTAMNGYTGTVMLSCANLPPDDVCTFTPSSVTVPASSGGPGISTLTISAGLNSHNNSFPLLPGGATLAVALCCFGFKKRRRLQLLVLLGASVIGLSMFTGCGTPGSVPNTVTITVIGTDTNNLVETAPLTLTQMQSQ